MAFRVAQIAHYLGIGFQELRRKLGDDPRAGEILTAFALQDSPLNAYIILNELGASELAEMVFEEACRINPTLARLAARAIRREDHIKKAESYLERITEDLKKDPFRGDPYLAWAIYNRWGKFDEAARKLEELCEQRGLDWVLKEIGIPKEPTQRSVILELIEKKWPEVKEYKDQLEKLA